MIPISPSPFRPPRAAKCWRCAARNRPKRGPKSRQEAKAVLRFMAAHEMFDRNETDAVLENLVG